MVFLLFLGFGIDHFSLFESGRRDEIADGHLLFLCCFCDVCGFFFRIVGEDGFPHSVM